MNIEEYIASLKKMSEHELILQMGGKTPGATFYLLAKAEYDRRIQKRAARLAWVAIAISGLAFIVSIVALFRPL